MNQTINNKDKEKLKKQILSVQGLLVGFFVTAYQFRKENQAKTLEADKTVDFFVKNQKSAGLKCIRHTLDAMKDQNMSITAQKSVLKRLKISNKIITIEHNNSKLSKLVTRVTGIRTSSYSRNQEKLEKYMQNSKQNTLPKNSWSPKKIECSTKLPLASMYTEFVPYNRKRGSDTITGDRSVGPRALPTRVSAEKEKLYEAGNLLNKSEKDIDYKNQGGTLNQSVPSRPPQNQTIGTSDVHLAIFLVFFSERFSKF